MPTYFGYTSEATDYLSSRDRRLGRAIAAVEETCGHILRETDEDLFSAVIHHIVGQQISNAAQRTVWERLRASLGSVCPERVDRASAEELQSCGMTFKKAEYIKDFARKVNCHELDLAAVERMDDADAITALCSLRGVGVWTAEMLLLFCLERPDVLSFDDLAISPPQGHPRAIRALSTQVQPVWKRCEPVSVGHRRRPVPRVREGLRPAHGCAEKGTQALT